MLHALILEFLHKKGKGEYFGTVLYAQEIFILYSLYEIGQDFLNIQYVLHLHKQRELRVADVLTDFLQYFC